MSPGAGSVLFEGLDPSLEGARERSESGLIHRVVVLASKYARPRSLPPGRHPSLPPYANGRLFEDENRRSEAVQEVGSADGTQLARAEESGGRGAGVIDHERRIVVGFAEQV